MARLRRHGAICLVVTPEAASIAISHSCGVSGSCADTLERDRVRPVARSSLLAWAAHGRAPRRSKVSGAAVRCARDTVVARVRRSRAP